MKWENKGKLEKKPHEVFTIRNLHYDFILRGVPASNVFKLLGHILKMLKLQKVSIDINLTTITYWMVGVFVFLKFKTLKTM